MFARMTTTVLAAGEENASAEVFEQVLPAIRELDGFKGMLILSEVDGPQIVSVTLWDSREALEAATAAMDKLRDAESAFRGVDTQQTGRFIVSGAELAL